MAGTTTQDTEIKFVITFKTDTGKKKSMTFKHSESYGPDLATRLTTIANAMVTNTRAFNDTFTGIDALRHDTVTKTTFSERNS